MVTRSRSLCLAILASVVDSSSNCNQENKQKAIYAQFTHEPALRVAPGLDMMGEITMGDPSALRKWGRNGLYDAWMTYWGKGSGSGTKSFSGYFGTQIKGKRVEKDMLLFSIWDKHPGEGSKWQATLPRHSNCKRNCNDCSVHEGPGKAPDGSTGTKCWVNIPDQVEGTTLRMRIRRVAQASSEEMYGRTWTGDEWEVTAENVQTGQKWTVGRQLMARSDKGITTMTAFHEHIGCTPCRSFELTVHRRGPWVLEPSGTRLVAATSSGHNSFFTCMAQETNSSEPGSFTMTTGMPPPDKPKSAWTKNPLYTCNPRKTDKRCDAPMPATPVPPSSTTTTTIAPTPDRRRRRRGAKRRRRTSTSPSPSRRRSSRRRSRRRRRRSSSRRRKS